MEEEKREDRGKPVTGENWPGDCVCPLEGVGEPREVNGGEAAGDTIGR